MQKPSDASEIQSGIALKRVYNIEKVEVVNPKFASKERIKDKSKKLDKKYHSQTDAHNRREARKAQRKKELSRQEQAKSRLKPKPTIQKRNDQVNRQKKREIAEKILSERKSALENTVNPPVHKKSLEQRVTTKIWQILTRDMFLLDHEKFNNQIQATNSETKKYIISVIKKCNNKELKKLYPSTLTQTDKESKRKGAIKCALRRRLWAVAKASIKHSKHWSQFLAENNIIVENINIDKFDLSLIDLEALGIENKVLKRTLTWLFK